MQRLLILNLIDSGKPPVMFLTIIAVAVSEIGTHRNKTRCFVVKYRFKMVGVSKLAPCPYCYTVL